MDHYYYSHRGELLPCYSDVNDLYEAITDYFDLALKNINESVIGGKLPNHYWDTRAREWSFCISAYMSVLKRMLSIDFDNVNDMGKELDTINYEFRCGKKESKPNTLASEYFTCAIAMMEDLLDYIYCVTGTPC